MIGIAFALVALGAVVGVFLVNAAFTVPHSVRAAPARPRHRHRHRS